MARSHLGYSLYLFYNRTSLDKWQGLDVLTVTRPTVSKQKAPTPTGGLGFIISSAIAGLPTEEVSHCFLNTDPLMPVSDFHCA